MASTTSMPMGNLKTPLLRNFVEECNMYPQHLPYDDPDVPHQFIHIIAARNFACGYAHLGACQLRLFRENPFVQPRKCV